MTASVLPVGTKRKPLTHIFAIVTHISTTLTHILAQK
jgi:hypothetical protein